MSVWHVGMCDWMLLCRLLVNGGTGLICHRHDEFRGQELSEKLFEGVEGRLAVTVMRLQVAGQVGRWPLCQV